MEEAAGDNNQDDEENRVDFMKRSTKDAKRKHAEALSTSQIGRERNEVHN